MKRYEALTPKLALYLANPRSWVASVYPAIFAELYCLWAGYSLRLAMAVVLLAICVLMQSAVNTLNDHFDALRGNDSTEDCLEENDAVLLHHHLNPRHPLLLGLGFLGAAGLMGLWIIMQAGIAPLMVGAIGGAVVLMYSAGPLPLSFCPIGELISGFVMGGLIPLGIAASATGNFCWEIIPAALPFILGIGLIMMTNNCSDIEKDIEAGRKTLPVLLGRERARSLYRVLLGVWMALVCIIPLALFGVRGAAAPLALALIGRKPFAVLMKAPLDQENRIWQIIAIVKANLTGNGAYLIALLAALL